MNRKICTILAAAFCLVSFCAYASNKNASADAVPEAPVGLKVGYVDFDKALNEVSDGKAARSQLSGEFKDKQKVLDKMQEGLKAEKDEIDSKRLMLSPEETKKREESYRQKYFDLQQKLVSFRREIAGKESKYTDEILAKLREIVREIGRREGFSIILEKSQDVVVYAPDGSDVTAKVISEYDGSRSGRRK